MTLAPIEAEVSGLAKWFEDIPKAAEESMRLAINTVITRTGLKLFRDQIQLQVAFPSGYLTGDRLQVTKKAFKGSLEGVITARQRATSLARFATGANARGVRVRVNPGSSRFMAGAFLMRLRRGASLTEDSYNAGLAIRLKPGDIVRGKKYQSAVQADHTLQLLYGPSVDQVFRDVARDESPQIEAQVETEFLRNFARLAG